LVIEWAEDKDIFSRSNPVTQLDKTLEEYLEARDHAVEYSYENDRSEPCATTKELLRKKITDDIGDLQVTLIIFAEMFGLTLEECLEHAYKEIKDRTGKMVDGIFVKDK